MPDTPPARIGRYQVLGELGRGGMGAVFECLDPELDRKVAVKLLAAGGLGSPETKDAARRLRDEARAAAKLRHPGLVTLTDTGEDPEAGAFLVYELMRGGSLRRRLELGPLGWDESLERVARPVLGALDALHRIGVYHRDVKPENLLADAAGLYHLADLGLATFSGKEARTATGVIYGTPGYLAPECYLAPGSVDPVQLDGYAAALTLVECAGGRLPWSRPGQASIEEQLSWVPAAPDLEALGVPGPAALRLAKALLPDPRQRRAAPAELWQDLAGLAPGPHATVQASLPMPVPAAGKRTRPVAVAAPEPPRPARGSGRRVLVALAVLMAAAGFALLSPGRDPEPPERDPVPVANHEFLRELAAGATPRKLPVESFVAASRAFALGALSDPDSGRVHERWRAVLYELGSGGPTGSAPSPGRALLDACLEALVPGPEPDRADPAGDPYRLAAAVPILAWSALLGDLGPGPGVERLGRRRGRRRGGWGVRRDEPWTVMLWLATFLVEAEWLVQDGTPDELEAAAPALERILADPGLLPGHRTHLAAWLAGLADRVRRHAARDRTALPPGLVARLGAWSPARPIQPGPDGGSFEGQLWSEALAHQSRFLIEKDTKDLDQNPEAERLAWFQAWANRALWLVRTLLARVDPAADRHLPAACEYLLPVIHDWGTRQARLISQRLDGRPRYLLDGEPGGLLCIELCEALATSVKRLRATPDRASQRDLADFLECRLMRIGTDWLGRLDFWERPSRSALLAAVSPHLAPGSLPSIVLTAEFARVSHREVPPARDLLDLWDRTIPSLSDTSTKLESSIPWETFGLVAKLVHGCIKRRGGSAELGERLARLDRAMVAWPSPPGVGRLPSDWAERTLLMRADSALAGGRAAELAELRPRLEALLHLPVPDWNRMARALLAGRPLLEDDM